MQDGAFPIRNDITVLPADDPNRPILGWVIYEYMGHELTKEAFDLPMGKERSRAKEYEASIIRGLDDLKVGDEVFAYCNMPITITEVNGDTATGEQEHLLMVLEHGKDDRNCWVAGCMINKLCLDRVDFKGTE